MSSPVWLRRRKKRHDREKLAMYQGYCADVEQSTRVGYYDRNLRRISIAEWLFLGSDPAYKRVAFTRVGQGSVSTIWLGLDHSGMFPGAPPFVFESLVQCPWETDLHGEIYRYPNEAQARTGHASLVVALQSSRPWLSVPQLRSLNVMVAELLKKAHSDADPGS